MSSIVRPFLNAVVVAGLSMGVMVLHGDFSGFKAYALESEVRQAHGAKLRESTDQVMATWLVTR